MTQTEPIILCEKCYNALGYTKDLGMGKAGRENCDLCGG